MSGFERTSKGATPKLPATLYREVTHNAITGAHNFRQTTDPKLFELWQEYAAQHRPPHVETTFYVGTVTWEKV